MFSEFTCSYSTLVTQNEFPVTFRSDYIFMLVLCSIMAFFSEGTSKRRMMILIRGLCFVSAPKTTMCCNYHQLVGKYWFCLYFVVNLCVFNERFLNIWWVIVVFHRWDGHEPSTMCNGFYRLLRDILLAFFGFNAFIYTLWLWATEELILLSSQHCW